MVINYPNGRSYKKLDSQSDKSIQKTKTKSESFSNRGMLLEDMINESNKYYLSHNICVIHKKPTPITVVSVDYTSRSKTKINEAYFQTPSTLDYNGIYKSKYLDFDAKETKNKSSFPLSNFHKHQIDHMASVKKHGAICFAIFYFKSIKKIYILDSDIILDYWNAKENGGRKSIPIDTFEKDGIELTIGYQPQLDYIKIIDEVYF
ncbi:MAG: Holliday junction resolvase RecU [Caryophanon sp.]|nr:Holliday junction resolvase RecU [Caryophanon sp.]